MKDRAASQFNSKDRCGALFSRLLALLLISLCGCESINNGLSRLGQSSRSLFDYFRGNTPVAAARKMEDATSADARWQGINRLVRDDFGRRPPYTTRYKQIAQSDPDWLVRAMALRALNRARDGSATSVFIKALDDSNERVRLEAAKALSNVPDEKSIPSLLKLVNNTNETKDVRIAAADALKHYRRLEVARVLVNQLNERQYGVAWQARHSLKNLTGKDWHYDEAAWLAYLTKGNPFG